MLDDVEEIDIQSEWLNHIAIIDTPGTAIFQQIVLSHYCCFNRYNLISISK
jgi:hypothetical protein